ncbi:MAG: cation transporter, partial [Priestia megaterium]
MKHEDKKHHHHTGSCCSGPSSSEIENSSCCSSSSEAASTEEPSSCSTNSHAHSHSCCSDTIALTTDKSQHSCCGDHDIATGSNIEETAEYRVYGMDCPSCAATIEKSLKTLNDIQHVAINYNTGKLQVAAASESALSLIPNSVERLGFSIEPIQSNKKMKTYLIEGMDCAACANTIVNHLKTVPAVKD